MKRHPSPTTPEAAAPVDDWESMMAVSRANATNGMPWDFVTVLVTYALVRLIGVIRGAPRRIVAGTTRRIGSARRVSRDR
jgi:hypothetical protein